MKLRKILDGFIKTLNGHKNLSQAIGNVKQPEKLGSVVTAENSPQTITDSNPPNKGKIQLVIGLDFGTAFTKTVIGERRVQYAVPFKHHTSSINPYLLPTVLSVHDDKTCQLGISNLSGQPIEEMKMRLIKGDFSLDAKIHCAAFLALVLRHVKKWLFETHDSIYGDRAIEWFVNMGLPTASFDNPKLADIYREIIDVAWKASIHPEPVHLQRINDYFKGVVTVPAAISSQWLPSDRFTVFPEFAVQLMGYIQSPQRQNDLHALVDVGAGTLDFTIFNVHENINGENLFPIFAQEVKPLGTQFFIQHRLEFARPNSIWQPSPYENVPSDSDFEQHLSLKKSELREYDKPFRREIANLIGENFNLTKKDIYPESPKWQSGVPTFLCGGGATVGFYRNIFNSFKNERPPYKIKSRSLNVPEDLRASSILQKDYDRLSVAYGLSFDPYNIASIIKKQMLPELKLEPPKVTDTNFVSKEMV